ncbi:Na+/H+ antiporter subunit E [Acinetobacter apis]|nr:Na+/H+ antiporter subunit E [Acinetobacter apis]
MKKKSLMRRWLPHPLVSVTSGLAWLMLNHSFDGFSIVSAVIIAIIIPKLAAPFLVRTPHICWPTSFRLFLAVLWDIILSNFWVAKLVLGPKKNLKPVWYRIPLSTNHEHVNALLAMIITITPGTVSAGIDQERGDILVHALNTEDPDDEIRFIKERYESRLIKIFNAENTIVGESA